MHFPFANASVGDIVRFRVHLLIPHALATPKAKTAALKKAAAERISFAKIRKVIEYPDFLDVQVRSFQEFFQLETAAERRSNEGLFKVFAENFPISDSRENFVLNFIDYHVDPPKYSVDE